MVCFLYTEVVHAFASTGLRVDIQVRHRESEINKDHTAPSPRSTKREQPAAPKRTKKRTDRCLTHTATAGQHKHTRCLG